MSLNELSINEIIDKVKKNKNEVLRHSNLLSGWLQKLDSGRDDEYQNLRGIKMEIRTTIKELSILGGFCDKKARARIAAYSEAGAQFNKLNTSIEFRTARSKIDNWATQINSIMLNYERYPFKVSAGLELNWEIFKIFVKAEYSRLGFPGGRIGGVVFIIFVIIMIIIIFLRTQATR